MKYRYYFCEKNNLQLTTYLESIKVPYEVLGKGTFLELVCFNLWSNTTNVDVYMAQLENMKVGQPIIYAEYTAAEIKKARFLWILPKRQCVEITNPQDAYLYSCEYVTQFGVRKVSHQEQRALFAIEKEPSMKSKTAFWAESTGFAELFTDCRVQETVNANDLSGIEFKNVVLKNGKYSEKIFQVTSQNILKRECIGWGYGEKKQICDICGKEQYAIDSAYQLHLDFLRIEVQSDLYVTESIFGEGIAFPLYVISQRFYQLLKKNNLAGGITVSPVAEV